MGPGAISVSAPFVSGHVETTLRKLTPSQKSPMFCRLIPQQTNIAIDSGYDHPSTLPVAAHVSMGVVTMWPKPTYTRSVPDHFLTLKKSIIETLKVIKNQFKSYHFAKLNSDFNISGSKSPLFFGEFCCQTDSTNSVRELARGDATRGARIGAIYGTWMWDIMGYHGIPSGNLTVCYWKWPLK